MNLCQGATTSTRPECARKANCASASPRCQYFQGLLKVRHDRFQLAASSHKEPRCTSPQADRTARCRQMPFPGGKVLCEICISLLSAASDAGVFGAYDCSSGCRCCRSWFSCDCACAGRDCCHSLHTCSYVRLLMIAFCLFSRSSLIKVFFLFLSVLCFTLYCRRLLVFMLVAVLNFLRWACLQLFWLRASGVGACCRCY